MSFNLVQATNIQQNHFFPFIHVKHNPMIIMTSFCTFCLAKGPLLLNLELITFVCFLLSKMMSK